MRVFSACPPAIGIDAVNFSFDNSYARLPERFFARVAPARMPAPALVRLNEPLAAELGFDVDWLRSEDGVQMLAGNSVPANAASLAMAYAGHQFGNWVPRLGDGRAILLGEVIDRGGTRRDIQWKGAGRTPFSRGGDGRAVLGPCLREYLVSEAMWALRIPSTRALAVLTTGDQVRREGPKPGAVFVRVAASHVRIGTFEYFANHGDLDGVKTLADYVIERHYPKARTAENPYRALLREVIERVATLVSQWQCVGFIHGVMNTDNMSIAGETIDYGPCAFMDAYDPATVFSSIDTGGRYAYVNQPRIAQWNLSRLALALLPLLDAEEAKAVEFAQQSLSDFVQRFETAYRRGMLAKIGIEDAREPDIALAQELLELMTAQHPDMTLTFRYLARAAEGEAAPLRALFTAPEALNAWLDRWRQRLAQTGVEPAVALMRAHNPAFIPRNHRVEAAIEAAEQRSDFTAFEELLQVLSKPFEDQPRYGAYAQPPLPHEIVPATFCGT